MTAEIITNKYIDEIVHCIMANVKVLDMYVSGELWTNWMQGPIWTMFSKTTSLEASQKAAAELLASWPAADQETDQEIDQMETASRAKAVMLTGMLDCSASDVLYEKAVTFAKVHRHKKPIHIDIGHFLQALDVRLRAALGINEHSKYVMAPKPDNWKEDIRRACIYVRLSVRASRPQVCDAFP